MRLLITVIGVLLSGLAGAQDLTGIWRGQFQQNNRVTQLLNIDDRYKMEVQIDQRGKTYKAVTYSYKTTEFYGKATAKGTVNESTQKVVLEEIKIVDVRMRMGSDACIMTCFLQYSRNGDEEFLEGRYTSMNTRDSADCGKGTIFLRKVVESDFYKEPFLVQREKEKAAEKNKPTKITPKQPDTAAVAKTTKPPANNKPVGSSTAKPGKPVATTPKPGSANQGSPKTAPANTNPPESAPPPVANLPEVEKHKPAIPVVVPPVLKDRDNELVKVFKVNTRTVTVSLYDNGTIDKDTVSVYLNKKLVVSKQMLSLSPIIINVELDDDNATQELVMVAENLGEIPPNTSLMIVKAGNQQFEVRITSTEQKNAVVLFKYDKPK
ncbi:MAG TPA: hypothetical protein PLQ32_09640 [Flavihumibacter sp.]|nr:hypothetical protein [Flavihumibacter sp.]HPZ88354.1 hypothetical protein [Flavihumibacter sp.]HQD10670.1 hypothetical protein [Flavihumibacter sp.]